MEKAVSPVISLKWPAIGVLLIGLFIIALLGLFVHDSRLQYEERTAITTMSISQVLEQYIGAEIDRTDFALLSVADEIKREVVTGGAINKQSLNQYIARQHKRLPHLDSLRVANVKGDIAYGVGVPGTLVTVADRDYFIRLRNDRNAGIVIARPVVGRISGKWVLILARRLEKSDGSFGGVVYAAILLEHFIKSFSGINVGRNGVVSLRNSEMGLIARHPESRSVGASVGSKTVSRELLAQIRAGQVSGTYYTPSGADNIARTISYRKVGNYPLYIIVGLAPGEYLAEWWKETARMSVLGALFILVVIFLAWLLYRNIAEREKIQERLRKEHENFLKIFSAAPVGLLLLDRETVIGQANKAFRSMVLREPAQVIGMRAGGGLGCIHSLENPGGCGFSTSCPECHLRKGIENVLAEGTGIHGALINLTLLINGSPQERWLSVNAEPCQLDGLLNVIVTVDDYTDKKRTEEALSIAHQALAKSEKQLKDITSSLLEGIYVVDDHGNILFMNPEAEHLLGWTRTELMNKNVHDVVHNRKADGSSLSFEECGMHNVIKTGIAFVSRDEVFIRKDGTIFPISVVASPIVEPEVGSHSVRLGNSKPTGEPNGKVVAAVTSFRDITEEKRLERERDKLISELQEALANVKQLSGLLPICARCKKIRDDKGYWNQIETYISEHSEALFTHAICPDCGKKLYPQYYDNIWGKEER